VYLTLLKTAVAITVTSIHLITLIYEILTEIVKSTVFLGCDEILSDK